MAEQGLLTSKKIAEKLGVSPSKVAKYLKENNIEPTHVRGNCKYYGPQTVGVIESALKP
jgi:predicted transcriptional regulator